MTKPTTGKTLGFAELNLEITRRCNLACRHCFRGDAQNVDMSDSVIDALLDKVPEIQEVVFIGGEPLLNLHGMNYFMEQMQKRNIPLYYLEFTTNGTIFNETVIESINRWAEYVRKSLQGIGADTTGGVVIRVSTDHYHREQLEQLHFAETPDELYKRFENTFSDNIFTVEDNDNSDLYIVNLGRAKQFKNVGNRPKNVIDVREEALQYNYHRLAIRDAYGCLYQSSCPVAETSTGKARIADYIIDCECYMDVYGNLMAYVLEPYFTADEHKALICNVAEPVNLLEAVLEYNRSACTCSVGDNQKTMSTLDQLAETKKVW